MSRIVDYLRHTTSRGSEDSGLEDLCNMLDPEHKDVSIDLDTYHAIMKEWIDDCRKNEYWSGFLCPPNGTLPFFYSALLLTRALVKRSALHSSACHLVPRFPVEGAVF